MPRANRAIVDGGTYHVLNRGNGRITIFRKPEDYVAFLVVLGKGLERYPSVDLYDWCLMPNHWHLVLRPRKASALSDLMRWVGVTHVRRYQEHYEQRGTGHLYQGRFKSFPVQCDEHFLRVCRYVEANPRRAKLVARAEKWPWSSLGYRPAGPPLFTCTDWPVDRPSNWIDLVNEPLPAKEAEQIRTSIARNRPFGTDRWVQQIAKRSGLENTLRPTGRPRIHPQK